MTYRRTFERGLTAAWQAVRMVGCVTRGTEEWESRRAHAGRHVEGLRFLAKDASQKEAWRRLKDYLDASDD
jgi:hypothetical protein